MFGFHIKLNSYNFKDWIWLYKKIEAHISLWVKKWLSRGKICILKLVLYTIPFYWTSITKVAKGILTMIWKNMFLIFMDTRS